MHIHFKEEGGLAVIPGLSQPRDVESEELSKQDLIKLQRLIAEARFFELPGNLAPLPTDAADYKHYIITIEKDGQQHTVRFTDLVDNPALKELFAFLRSVHQKQQ